MALDFLFPLYVLHIFLDQCSSIFALKVDFEKENYGIAAGKRALIDVQNCARYHLNKLIEFDTFL